MEEGSRISLSALLSSGESQGSFWKAMGGGRGEPAAGRAVLSPRGTVLKAEEAVRSWSECNEKQGQHLTPPKSLRPREGPAAGTQTRGGRAVKGQCGLMGRRGKGHDPESASRASHGGGLLQNFMQSEGKASLDTGASRSAMPDLCIRCGKESKRRRNTRERRASSKSLPWLPPGSPARGLQGRSLQDRLWHS